MDFLNDQFTILISLPFILGGVFTVGICLVFKFLLLRIILISLIVLFCIINYNLKKIITGIGIVICAELVYHYSQYDMFSNQSTLAVCFAYATVILIGLFCFLTIKSLKE